jgi:hypothetical protein
MRHAQQLTIEGAASSAPTTISIHAGIPVLSFPSITKGLSMRLNFRSAVTITLALAIGISISAITRAKSSAIQQHQEAVSAQPQIKIPEVPADMAKRIGALQSAMQPSAKAWVEQQAHSESQKSTAPDAPSIEAAVYNRFPALNTRGSSVKAGDINALVAIVMMQTLNDSEKDLQDMMSQMQKITNAKQQLRDLLMQTQLEIKSNETLDAKAMCQTALCKSLPSSLGDISNATANFQKPVRISIPAKLTFADLRTLPAQFQTNLDSLNDISQAQQMKIQMLMDQRSKLIETMSNLMKTMADTNSAVIQNIK